jgi:transcriptional regulator of acetoin/glycerol metabolism
MNKDTKKVVDSSKQDQLTMVDNIVIGNSELGNKRIVLTTMIINTIKSNKVELKYTDRTTSSDIYFTQLNKVSNSNVRGFVDTYKKWLEVDTNKDWSSSTDTGKERMRILKDSFWVALPLIKAECLQKNKSGKQFTGNKNSEVFIDGKFAKKYSPNSAHQKDTDQVSMKFSELKKASQNYYADGSTNLNTNETSGMDNSFVASIKKMTRTINASKHELVESKEQAGTQQAVQQLAIACNQWSTEFVKVRDSNLTPQQKVHYKKAI